MVETDDGYFVVKWLENPQHRRILINEALCSELLTRIGIATPRWARIHVDARFLGDYPQAHIELHRGRGEIRPGWHFGSRVPVSPELGAVYDFLPQGVIDRVRNRADFLKALVFDLWTDNRDGRQAIFHRPANYGFRAEMIDHGHSLGFDGVTWCLGHSAARPAWLGLAGLYCSPQAERVYERSIRSIRRVTIADLKGSLEKVPREWICGDEAVLHSLFDTLTRREDRLPEMLTDTLSHIRSTLAAGAQSGLTPDLLHLRRPLHLRNATGRGNTFERPSRYVFPGWSFLSPAREP